MPDSLPASPVAGKESLNLGYHPGTGPPLHPNLLRGGSHSGNVAARTLADAGLLDLLSSDYAPASLLAAAVRLGRALGDLAAGLATVTAAPARATGLADRGRLAPGLAADLIRFRLDGEFATPRGVWVGGRRVA